ncbi:MAG: deoxyribodipyrimidine photo-lyase [Spirochaetia bacterium]|nr:deoxyribodipyrimidine photo-lyase [Spirochaetia bacterium]
MEPPREKLRGTFVAHPSGQTAAHPCDFRRASQRRARSRTQIDLFIPRAWSGRAFAHRLFSDRRFFARKESPLRHPRRKRPPHPGGRGHSPGSETRELRRARPANPPPRRPARVRRSHRHDGRGPLFDPRGRVREPLLRGRHRNGQSAETSRRHEPALPHQPDDSRHARIPGPRHRRRPGRRTHSVISLFWFRRDLRLSDNAGLDAALRSESPVLPIFIFDKAILGALTDPKDGRVEFIHQAVRVLKKELMDLGSDLLVFHGEVETIFKSLVASGKIKTVFTSRDYEPSARKRDEVVAEILEARGTGFESFKDQVIFEEGEILTEAGKPYTIYTPYKNKVLSTLTDFHLKAYPTEKYFKHFATAKRIREFNVGKDVSFPSLESLGFEKSGLTFPEAKIPTGILSRYAETRDTPATNGTSRLGLHLRFGTVSVRELGRMSFAKSPVFFSELIWRDFFMMILFHFPQVVRHSFRPAYDRIPWRNDAKEFKRWCAGMTGYPLVDAGMRELNATGFMHNRVRMVVASFLCKHLLIDWRWGERYFAKKLLDYDLSANNGNWQWAAGTGCDAAPYFRIFNPETQAERFDPDDIYIKKWIPEIGTPSYPSPIVEHKAARERALRTYKEALRGEDGLHSP